MHEQNRTVTFMFVFEICSKEKKNELSDSLSGSNRIYTSF